MNSDQTRFLDLIDAALAGLDSLALTEERKQFLWQRVLIAQRNDGGKRTGAGLPEQARP